MRCLTLCAAAVACALAIPSGGAFSPIIIRPLARGAVGSAPPPLLPRATGDVEVEGGDTHEHTDTHTPARKVPVTLLSGFLGAGKTTLLKSMLENKQDLRLGVIVNDMASVNVDSKLIRSSSSAEGGDDRSDGPSSDGAGGGDFVELQNGCMCCTMADELFTSLAQLITMNELRGGAPYDHIVIESSGISEPRAVRDNFQDAEAYQMALLERLQLDTLVTVVDAAAFMQVYCSAESLGDRPDLGAEASPTPNPPSSFYGMPGYVPAPWHTSSFLLLAVPLYPVSHTLHPWFLVT